MSTEYPPREAERLEDPQAELAQVLIEEYLRRYNQTLATVGSLPAAERKHILTQASIYASMKMAEIENRARVVHGLHGGTSA